MKIHPERTPLVILDVQDTIDQPVWNNKSNPDYLNVIQRLLAHWRKNGWPVLYIKHDESVSTSSYYIHGLWNSIKKDIAPIPGEIIVSKQQNCAFIGTELDMILRGMQVNHLVLTGVVIHNSMDATIRAGKALGYSIILPSDATTAVPVAGPNGKSWDAVTVHDLTLAILDGEYAEVMTSDEVINKVARSKVARERL